MGSVCRRARDESTKVKQSDDGRAKSENIKNRPSEDAKNTHHKVEATTSAAEGGMKPVEEDPSKLPEPEPPQLGSNGARGGSAYQSSREATLRAGDAVHFLFTCPICSCQSIARI
ncbi:hypothetical protein ZWY2020_009446 [Hordeum vulgare]|nr:hypothetical protein ZWY2020_009446 [Hordeum vulgare]